MVGRRRLRCWRLNPRDRNSLEDCRDAASIFALPRKGFEEEKFDGDEGLGAKSSDLRIIVAADGLSVAASGHIPVRRRYGKNTVGSEVS